MAMQVHDVVSEVPPPRPIPDHPDLSIVIPFYNEVDNVDDVLEELLAVVDLIEGTTEIITVDDGSQDGTGPRVMAWQERDARVRVIRFRRNFGQTAAIAAGFDQALGRIVVVMDGDGQNDPRDIPQLLDAMAGGADVVSGWRAERQDTFLMRRLPSKLANGLISRVTGVRLHDYGCTLKAYDVEVVRHMRLYGELHRFLPALAVLSGATVEELPVNHRARTKGRSKYGISRTPRVLLDLLTVKFLLDYQSRPMQFFGKAAIGCFGGASLLGLRSLLVPPERRSKVSGSALSIAGAHFLCFGLISEVLLRIYHESSKSTPYVILEMIGFIQPGDSVPTSLVSEVVDLRPVAEVT